MGITRILCIFCGAPVDTGHDQAPWMSQFRVLYTVLDAWDEARLSGIGQRRQFNDVIPLDQSVDAVDLMESKVDEDWVEFYSMKTNFGDKFPPDPPLIPHPLWGFVMHDACWKLFLSKDSRVGGRVQLQALFDLCRSQPIYFGAMAWGHNYGGILVPESNHSDLCPGEEPEITGLLADVNAQCGYSPQEVSILVLDAEPRCEAGPLPSDHAFGQDIGVELICSVTNTDPFQELPQEIMLILFGQLPSKAVCALRSASRTAAHVALDETFWRSRFLPERQFNHLFPLVQPLNLPGKWRAAFTTARSIASSPHMLNRKRIWDLVSEVEDLVRLRLQLESSRRLRAVEITRSQSGVPIPPAVEENWSHANGLLSPLEISLNEGSRALFTDITNLDSSVAEICISTVRIGERQYVSGMRFTQANGTVTIFGYNHKRWNISPSWEGKDTSRLAKTVTGFHVAVDARGIRGLRIICAIHGPSSWAGEHEGIPKKLLSCAEGRRIHRIKGGFDALKMVSLSIWKPDYPQNSLDLTQVQQKEPLLWFPDIPGPGITPSAINVRYRHGLLAWLPYSVCLFGAKDGSILPYLSHIKILSIDYSHLRCNADYARIFAIEFGYSRPASTADVVMLGKTPAADSPHLQSHVLELDSAGGERIRGIDVSHHHNSGQMLSIRFYTTTGRAVEIPPNYTSITPHDMIDCLQMRAPENSEVVGVYGQLKHGVVLYNLGLLYADSC